MKTKLDLSFQRIKSETWGLGGEFQRKLEEQPSSFSILIRPTTPEKSVCVLKLQNICPLTLSPF